MSDSTELFTGVAHERAAERAVRAVTDEHPREIERVDRGNRKQTVRVRFDERGPVVVQTCDQRTWLRTESALLSRIREQTELPVPPVLTTDVTDGVASVATAYVPGDSLHERFTQLTEQRQRDLSRSFGRYLGTLHETFQFERYGQLAVEDGDLVAESADWAAWFVAYGLAAIKRLPAEFDPLRERLRGLVTDHRHGDSPPACLFPWDFRPGNALVADSRVTAILDWEAPLSAAPALSAAKAEYLVARWYTDEPAPLRAAFVSGYETVREYPAVHPAHRAAAIADSAVDSAAVVTNPGFPEVGREAAISFHREALADLL